MNKVQVSVVMAVHNSDIAFLKQSVNSILNQTYKNFEVIIIYDDEDKNELLFLKKITKNKKKIRIIDNKKNLGPGLSRNKGIHYARGDFVAFIDADDIWKKNKLEYQTKFMLNNNALISHTSYEILKVNQNTLYGEVISNLNQTYYAA